MVHQLSVDDQRFIAALEAGHLTPAQFDHRAHVRAAYVYLIDRGVEAAAERMRQTLLAFLELNGAPASKYHATITRAWILAVRHFMERSASCASADEFMEANPVLLDSRIMLTHYSAELLFSADARADFIEPDHSPIPRHEQ